MVDGLELGDARLKSDQLKALQEAAEKLPELEAAAAEELRQARLDENAARAGADLSVLAAEYRQALIRSNAELEDLVSRFRQVVSRRRRVLSLAQQLLELSRHVAMPGLDDQPGVDQHSAPAIRQETLSSLSQQILIDAGDLWPLMRFSGGQDAETRVILNSLNLVAPGSVVVKTDPSSL